MNWWVSATRTSDAFKLRRLAAMNCGVTRLTYVLLWIAALVTPLYWIVFFAGGHLAPSANDVGMHYEIAFPAADIWMAIAAGIGAIALRRRSLLGYPMAFAAAGSMLYLALLDITFDLENGVYLLGTSQVLVEAVINFMCVFGSLYLFYDLLRSYRASLIAWSSAASVPLMKAAVDRLQAMTAAEHSLHLLKTDDLEQGTDDLS
jgi:hypothetical protein